VVVHAVCLRQITDRRRTAAQEAGPEKAGRQGAEGCRQVRGWCAGAPPRRGDSCAKREALGDRERCTLAWPLARLTQRLCVFSGKAKKKKWSKGKNKEKVNNAILYTKESFDKMLAEVPKFKMITVSILSDRLRINCSLARRTLAVLIVRARRDAALPPP
jgi:ribosomal protein S25